MSFNNRKKRKKEEERWFMKVYSINKRAQKQKRNSSDKYVQSDVNNVIRYHLGWMNTSPNMRR